MKALLLFPLSSATKLHCLQMPEKRGSENLVCLAGVPQGLVLGPSQISYSPGGMFSPQGVGPQTDSQAAAHPPLHGPGAASQHTTLQRTSLVEQSSVELMLRGLLQSVCLSDTLPCRLICSHSTLISQFEASSVRR